MTREARLRNFAAGLAFLTRLPREDSPLSAQLHAGGRRGRLAAAVFAFDSWLRRRQGVFEYCDDPECLFRLQRVTARRAVRLADGSAMARGDALLALHFWNEHMPPIGPGGPNLAWARRLSRLLDRSLRLLERRLAENAEAYRGIVAIRADLALGPAARGEQIARILARLGFERISESENRIGPMRRIGENALMLMLVAAANPAAARGAVLRRDHLVAYLSRRALERRYRGVDEAAREESATA